MSKNFDLIATVAIDLRTPIVDDTSFDHVLIMGPAPKADSTVPAVAMYSNITEVEDAGYVVTGAGADPVGVAARVAFAQNPTPDYIYVATQQVVSAEDGEATVEPVADTIRRAMAKSGWYALCPAGVDTAKYKEIADYIEPYEKLFYYTDFGFFANDVPDVDGEYYRTLGIFGGTDSKCEEIPEANLYANVAHAVVWLSHESGSETAAFKTLSLIEPAELSSEEIDKLESANMNYFITVGSGNLTMNGKVIGGEWADVIRFRDWQKNDMQVAVVNLFRKRAKVPYTDSGITLVQNQMNASLLRGQKNGGIAEDEYDEDGVKIPGFVTSVPRASSITSAEKQTRKLRNLKFKARLAGAIHFAEINGSLTYEL